MLSAIEFVAVAVLTEVSNWPPELQLLSTGQLVLLCIVWAVANSVAARRW